MKTLYMSAYGPIDLSAQTLNGFEFPADVWERAFRLAERFGRDRFEYLADYYAFKVGVA